MARENEPTASDPSRISEEPTHVAIDCPKCGSQWTCDPPDSTCPDCGASFSVRIRDEFALVERSGWTVAVSLSTPDWQGVVGDG